MKKLFFLCFPVLITTGCDNIFNGKIGIRCDDAKAVQLLTEILDDNFKEEIKDGVLSNFFVKTDRIVEWDYKNGRYLCKAKVYSNVLDRSALYFVYKSFAKFRVKDNRYEGWVYYQTYLPTAELEKMKNGKRFSFYVEILDESKVPVW